MQGFKEFRIHDTNMEETNQFRARCVSPCRLALMKCPCMMHMLQQSIVYTTCIDTLGSILFIDFESRFA